MQRSQNVMGDKIDRKNKEPENLINILSIDFQAIKKS
jgi:hypothetical protein